MIERILIKFETSRLVNEDVPSKILECPKLYMYVYTSYVETFFILGYRRPFESYLLKEW